MGIPLDEAPWSWEQEGEYLWVQELQEALARGMKQSPSKTHVKRWPVFFSPDGEETHRHEARWLRRTKELRNPAYAGGKAYAELVSDSGPFEAPVYYFRIQVFPREKAGIPLKGVYVPAGYEGNALRYVCCGESLRGNKSGWYPYGSPLFEMADPAYAGPEEAPPLDRERFWDLLAKRLRCNKVPLKESLL